MASVFEGMPDEVVEWYEANDDSLRQAYEEEVDEDADSFQSKQYRLNSDDCFFEWVWDRYDRVNSKTSA